MGYLDKQFEKKYGTGNYQFYRCINCKGLMSNKDIKTGQCKCGGVRVSPTALRFFEKIKFWVTLPW